MEIIPAIDIRGGRCVRLEQGDYARETVFADDPVEVARRWERLGARRLHVVDLDGAREGRPVNRATVEAIVRAAGIPVQVGGGIRAASAVREYLEAGAQRVILGTSAVDDTGLVAELAAEFPEAIVVSIDARDGMIATDGWTRQTREPADRLVAGLRALGVGRFVYTDVTRDGTLTEPNYDAIAALVARVEAPIIAAGGIARVEHLTRLAEMGVEGAIIGRALYTGDIDLTRALEAVATR